MHVLSAIHQYVAVNIWSEEGFRRRTRSPSSTYFCPVLDLPLGISGRNHYQNGSILSLELSLNPSCLALDPPQGGSGKKPKHMCGP